MTIYQKILQNQKASSLLIIIFFLLLAFFYLYQLNKLPLTAYDEAIYAQVTRQTLVSSQITTLYNFGQAWLEKPPLYFWLAMTSVKIFGDSEAAFRLPSALLAILSFCLVYLVTKKLSGKKSLGLMAAFILAIIPFYYITGRQVRLDVPLTAIILSTIYVFILGWDNKKYLLGIFPLMALAVLTKNIVGLLAIPFVLIFSLIYKQWSWLKSKYFWLGLPIGLLLAIPWHWRQYQLWGNNFLETYLGFHVLNRFSSGFGNVTQTNPLSYFHILWDYSWPWWQIFILLLIVALILKKFYHTEKSWRLLLTSWTIMAFVIFFFSLSKTKISSYLLLMYPYLAIAIAVSLSYLWQIIKHKWLKILYLLFTGALCLYSILLCLGQDDRILKNFHFFYDYNLRDIGRLINLENKPNAKIYYLSGPPAETINFYAQQPVSQVSVDQETKTINLSGPAFIYLYDSNLPLFLDDAGQVKKEFSSIRVKYSQDHILLLYGEQDIVLHF
ncbi:MAG: glycosyltransferase family 39 protein [Patescibacteria group bacterium]